MANKLLYTEVVNIQAHFYMYLNNSRNTREGGELIISTLTVCGCEAIEESGLWGEGGII